MFVLNGSVGMINMPGRKIFVWPGWIYSAFPFDEALSITFERLENNINLRLYKMENEFNEWLEARMKQAYKNIERNNG
jgi:hypothetical protein